MLHSTVTGKGQTTIPGPIRKALGIKPGDRLTYDVEGDRVSIRIHPGLMALKGILSDGKYKNKNLSFAQIRKKAAEAARREWKKRNG